MSVKQILAVGIAVSLVILSMGGCMLLERKGSAGYLKAKGPIHDVRLVEND